MTVAPPGNNRRGYLVGLGASVVSGVLTAASMPNFDVSFLGWIALIPLLYCRVGCCGNSQPTARDLQHSRDGGSGKSGC